MDKTLNALHWHIGYRFNCNKNDYETEWGKKQRVEYLARFSELHYFCTAFGFETLAKQIRDYMNENF